VPNCPGHSICCQKAWLHTTPFPSFGGKKKLGQSDLRPRVRAYFCRACHLVATHRHAVAGFDRTESQHHWVEIWIRDYAQQSVGICVRGPRGHQVVARFKGPIYPQMASVGPPQLGRVVPMYDAAAQKNVGIYHRTAAVALHSAHALPSRAQSQNSKNVISQHRLFLWVCSRIRMDHASNVGLAIQPCCLWT